MKTLHELFVNDMKNLHSAETMLLVSMPRMARSALSEELASVFHAHIEETEVHVDRLERILDDLGIAKNGATCRGMEGLIVECEDILMDGAGEHVIDAALIGAGRRIEHYEIAMYDTAILHAKRLGIAHAMDPLGRTLAEEQAADRKLALIVESDEIGERQPT